MINIAGVETFSMVDYPGQMSAVIFMQGCPWRCPFCHNGELQKIGKESGFEWKKFTKFLEERKGKLDAVVFSGGEPLVQENVVDAIKEVKVMGCYKIGLHTGGYRPKVFEKVLPEVNWVGFDIKAPLTAEAYRKSTGGYDKVENVRQSLKALLESGIDFECRTTCDPRILEVEDIYAIADSLKDTGVKTYRLQRYRQVEGDATPDSECEKFFSDKALEQYLRAAFPDFSFRS